MKILSGLPVLLPLVMPFCAWGQSQDKVTIHVAYDVFGVRTRPSPTSATTHVEYRITLSGTNQVGVAADTVTGDSTKSLGAATTAFGKTTTVLGDANVAWRVAGPHKLINTMENTQTVGSATITVAGKTCAYKPVVHLKPGFKEYQLYSSGLGGWAYYSEVRYSNITCTIE